MWAKFNGYPYWPAKVLEKDPSSGTYDVRFFGDEHSRAEVGSRNIKPIETSPSKLRIGRRTAAWKRAYEELQKFQQLASASQEQSISVNGRGSTLADGASFAFNHDELRGRDGIVKEENTITSSDRGRPDCFTTLLQCFQQVDSSGTLIRLLFSQTLMTIMLESQRLRLRHVSVENL